MDPLPQGPHPQAPEQTGLGAVQISGAAGSDGNLLCNLDLLIRLDTLEADVSRLAGSLGAAVHLAIDQRSDAYELKFNEVRNSTSSQIREVLVVLSEQTKSAIADSINAMSQQNRETSTRIIDKLPILAKSIRDECAANINMLSEEFHVHLTAMCADEAAHQASLVANKVVLAPSLVVAPALGTWSRVMPSDTSVYHCLHAASLVAIRPSPIKK